MMIGFLFIILMIGVSLLAWKPESFVSSPSPLTVETSPPTARVPSRVDVADINVNVSTVEWGTLYPNSSSSQRILVSNNGTIPVVLELQASNFNPANASLFLTLSWDYSGKTLAPTESMIITLILTVSPEIQGIDKFSFAITIFVSEA